MLVEQNQTNIPNESVFTNQLQILSNELEILPDKPDETPETTLCTLWHFVSGYPCSCKIATHRKLTSLVTAQIELLETLVEERIKGKPLAYIVGRQSFMGLEMIADAAALIPRKETELLAEICLKYIRKFAAAQETVNVVDLFTGSGNLPLCFKSEVPDANVYGLDLSDVAIALAKKNSNMLDIDVLFKVSDMFSALSGQKFSECFDVISGAPPYICAAKVKAMAGEISNHEPSMAFDAGPFGVKFFNKMITGSTQMLKPGGMLIFEVGLGQGDGIAKRLIKNKKYGDVQLIKDAKGDVRVLAAKRL